jgi:hypothetical protein
MTYLELVNNILIRLRERQVTTVNETAYSSLVGLLINDAKDTVENSWKWSGLRLTLSTDTTSGVFSYELNGSQNRFTLLDVVNDTDNSFMSYKSAHEFNNYFLNSTIQQGSPLFYSFNGVSSDGDTIVDIYPVPDNVYTLRFNMVQRSLPMVEDSDTLSIPSKPIELLAYAKAVEERGEDGGVNPVSAYTMASISLSDAIALDSDKHPEELTWYEG